MPAISVALAQFRPEKGAVERNLDRIGELFTGFAGADDPVDLLLLPETITTGYFLEGGVVENAVTAEAMFAALAERHRDSGAAPIDLCLGFYELHRDRIHNSAIWLSLGGDDAGIRHVHRKVFLPTYGVFDEERFVEAGQDVRAFDTRFGRVAMLVCEDAWHSLAPTIAAVDGARLIVVPSASPARGLDPDPLHPGQPRSLERWQRLAREIAAEHGVFVAIPQLVGFEGGKGFPGGSLLVGPDAEPVLRLPLFEVATEQALIDLDRLATVRASSPLLADLEARLPHLMEALGRARRRHLDQTTPSEATAAISVRQASHRPVAPAVAELAIDCDLARSWLVHFIRDEVTARRGFERAIVGLSGGVDSAVVAFLAAEALGADRVCAVRMPHRDSSKESLAHARLVTEALGIEERTVEITAAVSGLADAIGGDPGPTRLGNIMARIRMTTLFDLSAELKALPLGTGNKSERLLGYFTWHADDTPPVNPIGDLFKTQVWELARSLGVPEVIISKPASADLERGQTDEGDFGFSYARADVILDLVLRGNDNAAIIAAGYDQEEVARVRQHLDATHWKRRMPTTAMLSGTAIGEYYLRPVDY